MRLLRVNCGRMEEEEEGELKLVLGQQLPLSHVTHCHTRPAESHGNRIFTGFSNPNPNQISFSAGVYLFTVCLSWTGFTELMIDMLDIDTDTTMSSSSTLVLPQPHIGLPHTVTQERQKSWKESSDLEKVMMDTWGPCDMSS